MNADPLAPENNPPDRFLFHTGARLAASPTGRARIRNRSYEIQTLPHILQRSFRPPILSRKLDVATGYACVFASHRKTKIFAANLHGSIRNSYTAAIRRVKAMTLARSQQTKQTKNTTALGGVFRLAPPVGLEPTHAACAQGRFALPHKAAS